MFFKFLRKFIISNPVKIFLVFVLASFAYVTFNFTYEDIQISPIATVKDGCSYVYVYRSTGSSSYSVMSSTTPFKIFNGSFVHREVTSVAGLCGFFGALLLIFLVVGTFIPDDDTDWGLVRIWNTTRSENLLKKIKCDTENDVIFYHIDNRLLGKFSHRASTYDIQHLIDDYIKAPNTFPEFEGTKQIIRDKKLEKILAK